MAPQRTMPTSVGIVRCPLIVWQIGFVPHALRVARLALQRNQGRILRICWETNGSMHPALLKQAAEISLNSGGCIKFDLKAWDEGLHIALCGISNKRTLENFELLAFAPQFRMRDLPTTSRRHAEECLAEAKAQGLRKVRVGNAHLLGSDY